MRQVFTCQAVRMVFTIASSLLIWPAASWAQQAQMEKYVPKGTAPTKYVEQHAIDVGDLPGHQIRVAQLQTTFTDEAPEFNGIKMKESTTSLSSDYINGSGRFETYTVVLMANGDKVFEKGEAVSRTTVAADGSKKTSYSQVITLIGGTGKFSKIRGTLRQTGATDFKVGTSETNTEGEYWFEK